MSQYQLHVKQIVDYPKFRIYRQFIRSLMTDRSIRTCGSSGLFYFIILCSYANFRTSYRRLDGINYTIYPGEWICRLSELTEWFRTTFQYQALNILERLQSQHYITYSVLGRGKIIKFSIKNWRYHNTVLDYNAPCQKDTGFFFIPVVSATELISTGRCSEMDCLLDLWINTVYNDEQVQSSDLGPVVYFRNGTGSPLICYAELAQRWGISKATVSRLLKRLTEKGHISLMTFTGNKGSAIYLQNYLSTMFQISDVIVDKDEVAMSLKVHIAEPTQYEAAGDNLPYSVSNEACSVSKSKVDLLIRKVAQILHTQGLSCLECPNSKYKLYPLSNACEELLKLDPSTTGERFLLCLCCGNEKEIFRFELRLTPVENHSLRRLMK